MVQHLRPGLRKENVHIRCPELQPALGTTMGQFVIGERGSLSNTASGGSGREGQVTQQSRAGQVSSHPGTKPAVGTQQD